MSKTIWNMDFGWKFHLGEVRSALENTHSNSYNSCKSGAEDGPASKNFGDDDWREVDLPHDYFSESGFSPDNLLSHGYRTRDNAWYRKTFTLPEDMADKDLLLCFEGTAVNAQFYFNGSLMERSFSAYTEICFSITERAYFDGRPNVLAVHIDGFATEGWWYEGAGIYRHVKLYARERLHIAHGGVFVKPTLIPGTDNDWAVETGVTVENGAFEDGTGRVSVSLFDGEEKIAEACVPAFTVPGDASREVAARFEVKNPVRWDVDDPKFYRAEVALYEGDCEVDRECVRTGFRTYFMDAEKGFFLNGRPIKLMGTCNHQDHAGVGVAIPDSIQYYRIRRLKDMGTNAYRCSHNLPAKEVLDACDEMGLIVMDENRRFESRREILDNLRIMVKRDRNHPSVVFYSLFNEEPLQNTEEGARIYRKMMSTVTSLDDTRILTGAINGNMEGAGLVMDATGINYHIKNIEELHALHPDHPIYGSENNSAVTTRGCYESDRGEGHVLANYDEETVPWGETIHETWDFVRKHEYFAGIFIWTGFDYRGEPTPFTWPSVSSQFGIMDTCGFAKDSFYYNRACFVREPMVHILPHWNWKAGDTVRVAAVTNCEEAELFLNGASLGRKKADVCAQPDWQVEFVPGEIVAKAYRGGECVAEDRQVTPGAAYALRAEAHKAWVFGDGQDAVAVNVGMVDAEGNPIATAGDKVNFEIIGDGILLGTGNGDPNSHESDKEPARKLYCGACQAIFAVKAGGKRLAIRISAEGVRDQVMEIEVREKKANIVPSIRNRNIGGITVSEVYRDRPDPTREIADNDMNSFSPVTLDHELRTGFRDGWRIYRATPRIPEENAASASYMLEFPRIQASEAEVYVDGQQVWSGKTDSFPAMQASIPVSVTPGSRADIRVLLHADATRFDCGIALAIRMYRAER